MCKRENVHRRLHEYNLSIKKSYTCLSDEELDSTVLAISSQFNNCGYKAMRGHLGVKGVKINFMYVCVYACMYVRGFKVQEERVSNAARADFKASVAR